MEGRTRLRKCPLGSCVDLDLCRHRKEEELQMDVENIKQRSF